MTTQATQPRWKQIIKERNLDISIVEVDELEKRLDYDFYKFEYVELINKIKTSDFISIADLNIEVSASAFYLSIANNYLLSGNKTLDIPFLRVADVKKDKIEKNINSDSKNSPMQTLFNFIKKNQQT